MTDINTQSENIRKVLATDLDGTLIPLPDSEKNQHSLSEISKAAASGNLELVYCTGRHFSSVLDAMAEHRLPNPEWVICDVGTSIHRSQGGGYAEFQDYARHLQEKTDAVSRDGIVTLLAGLPGLMLQQEDHQQTYKISYECESGQTEALVGRIGKMIREFRLPYGAHGSIDPFLNCGLIDVLPAGVSKAYALKWLAHFAGYGADEVVYAGDSGNDLSALTSGCRAIVVANAGKGLVPQVKETLKKKKKSHVLYVAESEATCGVLEGCRHFGWI